MKVIAGERKTGRTSLLISLCAEAEARGEVSYIVCHSQQEAWRIAQKARELNLTIGFPISYDEFLGHKYAGKNIVHFYIDNVDMLLRWLTPVHIDAVTILTEKLIED